MRYITILHIILLVGFLLGCRKSDYYLPEETDIFTDNGSGVGTQTWTKDMDIIIKGYVFVNEGQILTIEPGTVVRFKQGNGATASALIVARGGKIMANGTASEPIIFTSELDDLSGSVPVDTFGLWGGLIILGNAPVNIATGETYIEGIPYSEMRGIYGGNDASDNSGELSYLSIRYPGTFLHQGNEINGLTLGGVGNKTKIENIEIVNSADDGIEVFGGTVNLKYIIAANAHDDAFDYDLGYQGNIQYLLAIQKNREADCLIEGSGANRISAEYRYSEPNIANATLVGDTNSLLSSLVRFDQSPGGKLVNSILYGQKNGVFLQYLNGENDAYSQWVDGSLTIEHNLFYYVENNNPDSIFRVFPQSHLTTGDISANWRNYFYTANNELTNPQFDLSNGFFMPGIPTNNNLFDVTTLDSFFDDAKHKGAFLTYDWTEGWTVYKQLFK